MIGTGERVRAPLLFAAEHRAAMRAGIEEGVKLALPVAVEDERAAADAAREEAPGLRDFGDMPQIEPAAAEDAATLELEDLLVDEDAAVDAENAVPLVVAYGAAQPVERVRVAHPRLHAHAPGSAVAPTGPTNFFRPYTARKIAGNKNVETGPTTLAGPMLASGPSCTTAPTSLSSRS